MRPERTTGLEKDWDAVVQGLTTCWNSGPVEGRVNHIKMIKRQMFGRAKLPLLRKRVLLTATRPPAGTVRNRRTGPVIEGHRVSPSTPRRGYAMEITVQWIRTSWTKESRGGEAASRRNAAPVGFALPHDAASFAHA
ncbi:hypothetical protein [Streptomyces sp. NBC_01092]|uniref:hypothetical protein n=1 Tax=Streptomyces sp. NBC_01092 TaxID=2903748 RepID=UPI003864282A